MAAAEQNLFSRPHIEAWLLDFHATSATLDAEAFLTNFFAEAVEFRYANHPTITGRDTVKAGFKAQFARLESMVHEIVYFDVVERESEVKLYQAATIHYVVKEDDATRDVITVPGFLTGWLGTEDGRVKLKKVEIYVDVGEVEKRMVEKGL
ncbi:hypothetical protein H2198_008571 [Neophaeococcomyces mojaviensis]|uniref:Uncharacterized protein n=1 Tax=Neophaeococcomyces mojaviensis TaxID=3383035 RepID=A0ACC2ZX02_9EURO|nr:hypothetical protein H2198_008571 [Knufia sp. JES_112]